MSAARFTPSRMGILALSKNTASPRAAVVATRVVASAIARVSLVFIMSVYGGWSTNENHVLGVVKCKNETGGNGNDGYSFCELKFDW